MTAPTARLSLNHLWRCGAPIFGSGRSMAGMVLLYLEPKP
jgi:hypothetical protein